MTTTTQTSPGLFRPDSAERYGTVSRFLHWSMALCFALVFSSAIAHALAEDSAVDAFLWSWHKPFGALLMLLGLLRLVWALTNARQRPATVSTAARLGHHALYLLMLAIPAIGLLRQWGSAREFQPFGIPLMDERPGEAVQWMRDLGSLLHGEMGWLLLAMVSGHVAMVFWHRRQGPKHDVLPRMVD